MKPLKAAAPYEGDIGHRAGLFCPAREQGDNQGRYRQQENRKSRDKDSLHRLLLEY
jgi:hypothetical protein